ncbi:hypothetical protein O3G_MSEX000226 [Manduca sexta]|nr:hypothetical protein O3G_MSEX000226 [Manduca sexta]
MTSRSARLIKLATKKFKEQFRASQKDIDENIMSSNLDEQEETANRESPVPNNSELIQLQEMLGDVIDEKYIFDHENDEPIASTSTIYLTPSDNLTCEHDI